MGKILDRIDDYDWREAFEYANEPRRVLVESEDFDTSGFTREMVEQIIHIDNGMNDEESWIGVFKLTDGRYASLAAGCDYTGWD